MVRLLRTLNMGRYSKEDVARLGRKLRDLHDARALGKEASVAADLEAKRRQAELSKLAAKQSF